MYNLPGNKLLESGQLSKSLQTLESSRSTTDTRDLEHLAEVYPQRGRRIIASIYVFFYFVRLCHFVDHLPPAPLTSAIRSTHVRHLEHFPIFYDPSLLLLGQS